MSDSRTHATAARIQALVDIFAASPDEAVRERAQELVRLLMELYGAGLERVMTTLRRVEGAAGPVTAELVRDELVASLLLLHDLHPEDAAERIRRELGRVHALTGAEAELLEVDGARAARVRVNGRRGGARAPSVEDLRRLIDEMVRAVAPEVQRVDIEGLEDDATPRLVQLTSRPTARSAAESRAP